MFERVKNLIQKLPLVGSRKGSAMAENNPAPDLAAQLATLTGAVTALAESQKTVMGAVEKLATNVQQPAQQQPQPAAQPAAAAGAAKPLTLDDLTRVLNDRDKQSRESADLASRRQT